VCVCGGAGVQGFRGSGHGWRVQGFRGLGRGLGVQGVVYRRLEGAGLPLTAEKLALQRRHALESPGAHVNVIHRQHTQTHTHTHITHLENTHTSLTWSTRY
jgi:hypothetical protein